VPPTPAGGREFIWRQDSVWQSFESRFVSARAAIEEVMLQQPEAMDRLQFGASTESVGRSVTPGTASNGVTLHSGDILVSRGGFPTSALIARGNDDPGNFSHIALVHVDRATRAISVVEAHIEAGVSVSTADACLADKKLRVMVLRPRAKLPAMQRDPMLPHRAASAMLARAEAEHIPYDFGMDYTDPEEVDAGASLQIAWYTVPVARVQR